MFLYILLFSASLSLIGAIHEDNIEPQLITPDEYLEQVSDSVDTEIEANSMMGHKPPNRWYYSTDVAETERKGWNQKLERQLAVILVRHYNYLLHVRQQLKQINNELTDEMDLWPMHPISSSHLNDLPTGESHMDEGRFVGWKQPEWMDDLFHNIEGLRDEFEDLLED